MIPFKSIVSSALVVIALAAAPDTHFLGASEPEFPTVWVAALSPEQSAVQDCAIGGKCDKSSCCYDSGCCTVPWYSCYVQAEALFWARDNSSFNQPLVVNGNDYPVMRARDLDFDYEPGVRVTLGIVRGPCHCCYAWEFGYLGLWDSNASSTVTGLDNLYAPGDLGNGSVNGFVNADKMRADYSSELNSFEANCVKCCYRCCWTDCGKGCGKGSGKGSCGHGAVTHRRELDVLCGFRYVSFDEGLILASDNAREQVDARYDLGTDNDLYGLQLGARWRGYRNRLGLEALGKAGIYYNDASQRQILVDQLPSNPVQLRDAWDSSSDVAFLGELGLTLLYEVTPALTLRGGYSLLWIEGVALAPDQLDFALVGGNRIDMAGGAFYHGASLGLEFRH